MLLEALRQPFLLMVHRSHFLAAIGHGNMTGWTEPM
jgi:hypothetical protein